jgi:5-hydroxytryptamine receptor 1
MNQSIQNSTFILAINLDIPMNQRRMSLETQSFRFVVIVVGSLINFFVTVVIGCSRQLHYPRHLYWVAISLINQFCIIQAVIQIMANLTQIKVACQIFVLNAGVSFTIILTFLALTTLDRYLAIARHEWYKDTVTNRGTIGLLSIAFAVTYLAATSPFWTGFKNIKNCTINMTHMCVLLIYDLLLGIVCVILHAMIFVRSRKIINEQPSNFLQTSIALQFRPNLSIHNTPGKFFFITLIPPY